MAPKKDIKLVNIIKTNYEIIETQEKKSKEEISPLFRETANMIYRAIKVEKVFKSERELAKKIGKHHSHINRYVKAGEYLKNISDEQLAKEGLFAIDVKTNLRKVKTTMTPKNVKQLKKVATTKVNKKVTQLSPSICVTYLKDYLENFDDEKSVNAVADSLNTLVIKARSRKFKKNAKKVKAFEKTFKAIAKEKATK